jgi:U3 small nucleolar RNA-associated protein 4
VVRITAARSCDGSPECVWSLAVLADGHVVSGSSRGAIQVWDPQFGTLVSGGQHHVADVTCVLSDPGTGDVFAGGIDPTIVRLSRGTLGAPDIAAFENKDLCGFRIADRRRHHSADVRALALVSTCPVDGGAPVNFLLSGGNDADLLVHLPGAFNRQHPFRICPAPCCPITDVAPGSPARLLAVTGAEVNLWKVAEVELPKGLHKVCRAQL